jgi:SRSO17 transposase
VPSHTGSSPQHQPSLPLVQMRQQQLEGLCQPCLDPLRHSNILANRPQKPRSYLSTAPCTDPTDIAYYICFCPAGTPLEKLVQVAGSRWMVEECFQTSKNETGLDHYQVRGYTAWYRHITLSMAALAFLAILRVEAKKGIRKLVPIDPSYP